MKGIALCKNETILGWFMVSGIFVDVDMAARELNEELMGCDWVEGFHFDSMSVDELELYPEYEMESLLEDYDLSYVCE